MNRPTLRFTRTSVPLSLLLIFTAVRVVAQQAAVPDYAARIDQIAAEQMQKQHIPALTVAVGLDGHVLYSKGFGIEDLENDVPANAETLIRTGSLAKPITAVAAMTLVEAHLLDLDAPIQKYCPQFPQKPWPITTRELLTHTSGIRHYKEGEVESTKHFNNMSDAFRIFGADPLLFQPGTRFSYSTYGYTVLGCVVEGTSGQKFIDYIQEHVLRPAGMRHTFVDNVYEVIPHRARGYQFKHGTILNAGLMDSSYKIPGGGLVSTAEDMVQFGMALMAGKIVKPGTLAEIWTPTGKPMLGSGQPSTYGMGFGVLTIDGQLYVAHTGGQQGTSTDMEFIPGKHFAVAVFANDEDCEPFGVVRPILDLFQMPRPDSKK